MPTNKFFTNNGYPCRQIDNGKIRTISKVGDLYPLNPTDGTIVIEINDKEVYLQYSDPLQIGVSIVSGTSEERCAALRNYFKDFFVEAPNDGGIGVGINPNRQEFTATASQTNFTTTFDLPADINRVLVFVNKQFFPFTKSTNTVSITSRDAGDSVVVQII
ncbi:MAG: hypothetical protein QM802_19825 [Agriterribacter sp.]